MGIGKLKFLSVDDHEFQRGVPFAMHLNASKRLD